MEKTLAASIALSLMLAAASPQAMEGMDHAQAPCVAASLPAGMEGWSRRTPVAAGASATTATPLPIGEGATATLLPMPGVAYAVRPGKAGEPTGHGGLFAFTVPTAGRYRVALGSGGWIDVVSGGMPVASAAHAHGPACTDVRKMVDFDLRPGRHLLQIAGGGSATLPLMVSRLP
ncbi:MAG: homogentisate 1,2-dioxygenase [Sphingomonas sp.]